MKADINKEKWAIRILMFICIGLFIGIVLLIILDVQTEPPTLGFKMSIVLIEFGRGRSQLQVDAIQKYIHWYDKIFVLRHASVPSIVQPIPNSILDIVVQDTTTLEEAFINIKQLSNDEIGNNIFFIGDTTIPQAPIDEEYLFNIAGTKYAMLNFISPDEQILHLQNTIEQTMPSTVTPTLNLYNFSTPTNYVLSIATGNDYVFAISINQTITLIGNTEVDHDGINTKPTENEVWQTILLPNTTPINGPSLGELNMMVLNKWTNI